MLMKCLFVCATLLAWSCGDTSDPLDTTAPTIVSVNPANGATGVALGAPIEIVFSEPLDASTVSRSTVTLARPVGRGYPHNTLVTHDNGTVVVAPVTQLDPGGRMYLLTISKVADVAGNVMPDATLSFTTVQNAETRYVEYESGDVVRYRDAELDSNGRPVEIIYFNGPGANGVWFDADDDWEQYTLLFYEYDANGNKIKTRAIFYTDPGVNAHWKDDDDLVGNYRDTTLNASGTFTGMYGYSGPGLDVTWFTADDEVQFAHGRTFDSHGSIARGVDLTQRGEDGVWGTGDDIIEKWTSIDRDDQGRPTRVVWYNGAGDDGDWLTADDDISRYVASTFDARGELTRVTYDEHGNDGDWFTSDDVIEYHGIYHYSAGGTPTSMITYNGEGADGKWMTEDDAVHRWLVYDEYGREHMEVTYHGPGPDNEWFTDDDDVAWWYENSYDSCCQVLWVDYHGPGSDGDWFTDDDDIAYYESYEHDADGNRTTETRIYEAGDDGFWFTNDDKKYMYEFDSSH